jgi:hypothetical protein
MACGNKFSFLAGLGLLLAAATVAFGQRKPESNFPPPLDAASAIKEGRALVAELLAQQPENGSTNVGVLSTCAKSGARESIPVRVEVLVTPTNWLNIYETTAASNGPGASKLTVVHTPGQPNQFFLANAGSPEGTNAPAKRLEGNETMIPFAGSDFWVCDLGLDFLHWPQQRVLRKEMKRSQSCEVLESTNPHPAPGCYARVLCWMEIESPHGIVQAEAYDSRNEAIKKFEPKTLEQVNGQYEPEKLEIRNLRTRSQTFIEYDLKHSPASTANGPAAAAGAP